MTYTAINTDVMNVQSFKRKEAQRSKLNRQKKRVEVNTLTDNYELVMSDNHQLRIALQLATAQYHQVQLELQLATAKYHLAVLFQANGYVFTPEPPKSITDDFKRIVIGDCMLLNSEGTITGNYTMQGVDHSKLLQFEATRIFLTPLLDAAKVVFCGYLQQEVEVYIHSSAMLATPDYQFDGEQQRPQVMHADNIGFVAITVIIMLSEHGGDSTYILDAKRYGPDYSKELRESLLRFSMSDLKQRSKNAAIRNAISVRYGSLLTLTPQQFFEQAHQQRMSYGQAELFRSDCLHAGPFSMRDRQVLFVEIRVTGETKPRDTDFQFRFPDLMAIAGADRNEIKQRHEIWSGAGYMFPEDRQDISVDTRRKGKKISKG